MFASLPPTVQRTLLAQAGGATIEDVLKTSASRKTIYQIYFENYWVFPPLSVAADGSVLNPDGSVAVGAPGEIGGVFTGGGAAGMSLNDLPPKIVKAIQQRAPESEIKSITK